MHSVRTVFLEKISPCAVLFDTVRLFFLFEILKPVRNYIHNFLKNIRLLGKFRYFKVLLGTSLTSISTLCTYLAIATLKACALISYCALIYFEEKICPVRLFHTVRLLDTLEYAAASFCATLKENE